MKKLHTYCTAAVLATLTSTTVAADFGLEGCIAAALKQKPGDILKSEKMSVSGKPLFELEIEGADGSEWEFICDAQGNIIETEQEVGSAEDAAFKSKMKVSEKEAAATALKAQPGVIKEVEYEIENGIPSYEFDIVDDKGVETEVEVDAITGKITEVSTEEWQIGQEDKKK